MKVKPIVGKQPDGIGAVSIDITDGRDNCPVNVVVTPRGREHQNRGTRSLAGELFPEGLEVIPNEMAEEATTGDLTDICEVITKTTAMNATTKVDVIVKPAPRQVMVEVLEETRTHENTIEECTYGQTRDDQTEDVHGIAGYVSEIDHAKIFRAGRGGQNSGSEKDSVCMYEVIPQITKITRPMCNSISWVIEKDMSRLNLFVKLRWKYPRLGLM